MGDKSVETDWSGNAPPLGGDIVETTVLEHRPDFLALDGETLSFTIPPSSTMVTDPEIILLFRLKIELEAKSDATAADGSIALPCLAPSTLFKSLTLKLNEQIIHQSRTHDLEQYLMARLFTTDSQRKYLRETAMLLPDSPAAMDETAESDNPNFVIRKKITQGGLIIQLATLLDIPFLNGVRFLPWGTRIGIILTNLENKQRLLTDAAGAARKPRIKFLSAHAILKRHLLRSDLALNLHQKLSSGNANFYFKQMVCRGPLALPTGEEKFELEVSQGRRPEMLLLLIQETDRVNGIYSKNKLKFEHAKVKQLYVQHEADTWPSGHLERSIRFTAGTSPATGPFLELNYIRLMEALGFKNRFDAGGIPLTKMEYTEGTTVFAFCLTPDGRPAGGGFATPVKIGRLSVHFELESALAKPHSLFAFGVFSDRVSISPQLTYSQSYVPGAW